MAHAFAQAGLGATWLHHHCCDSFGSAWFDKDMRPTINSDEWKAAINFCRLLGTYGPPGRKAPSTKSCSTMKEGAWIDATKLRRS